MDASTRNHPASNSRKLKTFISNASRPHRVDLLLASPSRLKYHNHPSSNRIVTKVVRPSGVLEDREGNTALEGSAPAPAI
jgi:hypothetical protein